MTEPTERVRADGKRLVKAAVVLALSGDLDGALALATLGTSDPAAVAYALVIAATAAAQLLAQDAARRGVAPQELAAGYSAELLAAHAT